MASKKSFAIETVFKAIDAMTAPVSKMTRSINRFANNARDQVEKLDRALGGLNSGIDAVTGAALKFGAVGAGAVAGVGTFVTMTNQATVETIALAEAMGLEARAVEALDSVLSPAGLNAENVVDLIEEMNNKLGESKGLEELTPVNESLKILGLRFKDIKKLNPQEQFELITNAALKMKDAQQAAAAVDILMGGEANKVISLLRQRGGTLEEIINQQDAFNLLTDDARQGAKDYTSAMSDLWLLASSVGKLFAGQFGRSIEDVLTSMGEFVATNKELIQAKVIEAANKLADGLRWVWENLDAILNTLRTWAPVVAIVITLIGALKVLAGVTAALNVIMAANPVSLVVLAIVALVGATIWLISAWDDFSVRAKMITTIILYLMGPVGWLIGAAIMLVKNWDKIAPALAPVFSWLSDVMDGLLDKLEMMFGWVLKLIDAAGALIFGEDTPPPTATSGGGSPATAAANAAGPSVAENITTSIAERITTARAELNINLPEGASMDAMGDLSAFKFSGSGDF